jgi:hypothetical protein
MIAQSKLIELRNMLAREIPTYRSEYSLLVEVCDELMEYRAADAPLPTHKPTPVEALAERLAKVEDNLASLHKLVDSLTGLTERLAGNYSDLTERYAKVHERIDKVAEIIGERVSGLVDEITRAHGRIDILMAEPPAGPAFPTGGAHTLEGAAEAVLPVPQRGDRVRLEGAVSVSNKPVPDGWYDVIGHSDTAATPEFQIAVSVEEPRRSPWMSTAQPGLKEVRHADHT